MIHSDLYDSSVPGASADWKPSIAFQQAMDGTVTPLRATPADAFAAARERFRQGDRIDMVSLASDLGVARATLYRWTGDRDQLLADVITAELLEIMAHVERTAPGCGRERIEHAIAHYLDVIAGAPALRTLLANEGDSVLRMLTSPAGPIRPRLVGALADAIVQESGRSGYRPPAPPAILADGIVALGERYLHSGGDRRLHPDPETARVIVSLLLRENDQDETD